MEAPSDRLLVIMNQPEMNSHNEQPLIEYFHVTSRRPCWGPQTEERQPFWTPQLILRELNFILIQTLSFVLVENMFSGHVSDNALFHPRPQGISTLTTKWWVGRWNSLGAKTTHLRTVSCNLRIDRSVVTNGRRPLSVIANEPYISMAQCGQQ